MFSTMKRTYFLLFLIILFSISFMMIDSGCANIIPPSGGPKDSLPPVLVSSLPKDSITSFNAKNIVLNFDEYVQLDDVQDNLVVSPYPENQPVVTSKLKTVNIRLRDSLLPNTTYTLSFGKAIKDVNEGNVKRNFRYIFSTGKTIDQQSLAGKVILAESGAIDTTLIVVLQKNLADSQIIKHRPLYYTTIDGKGNFEFRNLPVGTFGVYVLPNDYTKRYDDSTKVFAFLNNSISLNDSAIKTPVTLYAYSQFKEKPRKSSSSSQSNSNSSSSSNEKKKKDEDKRLRFSASFDNGKQDILRGLYFTFNRKLKIFDSSKIFLTDTLFKVLSGIKLMLDTSATIVTLNYKWPEGTAYKIIIEKNAVADSTGITLAKNDTLSFITKSETDYGSITLRFVGLDLSRNPVLQMVQNEKIIDSSNLTQNEWHRQLYEPGDYEMRILFDSNKNGTWDPGDFSKKKQPEIVQAIPGKLHIRNDWENENEINLNAPPPATKNK